MSYTAKLADNVKNVTERKVDQAIDDVFAEVHQEFMSKSGDISPDQQFEMDKLKNKITNLRATQVMDNLMPRVPFTVSAELSAHTAYEDLEHLDQENFPEITTDYSTMARDAEEALDHFHSNIPISNLEDFCITCRKDK